MHFISFQVIFNRIKAISSMMKDRAVPKRKKFLVIIGIIYLFSPIRLIPPVLFPIRYVDSIVIWVWILWYLRDTLDTYWKGEKVLDLSKKFKDKDVIKDVDFEVKE